MDTYSTYKQEVPTCTGRSGTPLTHPGEPPYLFHRVRVDLSVCPRCPPFARSSLTIPDLSVPGVGDGSRWLRVGLLSV